MNLSRTRRGLLTATAAVTTAALVATSGGVAEAKPAKKPTVSQASKQFRKAVTVKGIEQHLDAFQGIADDHDGTRASGTPGYAASRDYVVKKLRAAGYKPQVQSFDFPFFSEDGAAQLARVSPSAKTYAEPADFATMTYSGSGDVTAAVQVVDTTFERTETSTSGCEDSDFAGFTAGSIALIQRGTCSFYDKALNASEAGASAVLVLNRGTTDETGPVAGTLGEPGITIPVLGISYDAGVELGAQGTTARVVTETTSEVRKTYNVVAETAKGDPGRVVMAGAHLDSVPEGPGINDNGSGSATILEVAEQLAKQKTLKKKVRFAWWGAEELGLLGSYDYVDGLKADNPGALEDIEAYLNFDMVGSPNFVRFVYDGDNSLGTGVDGPEGSAQIEDLFVNYFRSQKLATEPTAFDGRSDYGPFIENGIAAGGLFTGAEEVKTARQARIYGGTAGEAYDACYHQACDDRDNINRQALDQMSDAVAHSVYTLARSGKSLTSQGQFKSRSARAAGARVQGHGALR
ncbi:PA domain-containing protein [Nocardioides scoriae]|uniref:PA domain-containing protein n=1 Tax=Nocardioides scoriae TaxID=642780 RepID=A0A1H1WPC7_9ACTN|nr:M20/M25/M40 family metallo-hydrolase [Nocardioides scoriae]SDS98216.1 PA domain-containing protein [Nocardioides scoriae]